MFKLFVNIVAIFNIFASLASYAAEGDSVVQQVVGFEQIISKPGQAEERLVVETYVIETAAQRQLVEEKVTREVKEAIAANRQLNVEFVHADYSETSLPKITPINSVAVAGIEQARAAWGVSTALVSSDSASLDRSAIGFEEIINSPKVIATHLTIPPLINEADKYSEVEGEQAPLAQSETLKDRRITRVLTVVRTVSALGINGFMIYSALNGDIFTPLVVPALLFYPGLELTFQKLNVHYEGLLRSIPNIYGRASFRTGVSFACLLVHVGLLSSIGLTEFSLFGITVTAMKAAVLTHSWWELAISDRSKLISGRYVSFSLGILGMAGLLMETIGINFGSYILYGLGASGAIMWSRFGAFKDLKRDAIAAKDYFSAKIVGVTKYFRRSCESVHHKFFRNMLNNE